MKKWITLFLLTISTSAFALTYTLQANKTTDTTVKTINFYTAPTLTGTKTLASFNNISSNGTPHGNVKTNAGTYLWATFKNGIGGESVLSSPVILPKYTPKVTCSNPAPIDSGTIITATLLNCTADISGTFSYNPVVGTILPAGSSVIVATFTPTDTTNNNQAQGSINITVNPILAPDGITVTVGP